MTLPSLSATDPVIIPAQEAITYDNSYLVQLQIDPPDAQDKQPVTCIFRPYNRDKQLLYPNTDKDKTLKIGDIYTLMAQATSIVNSIVDLLEKINIIYLLTALEFRLMNTEVSDEAYSTLREEISKIKESLGVPTSMRLVDVAIN